MNLALLKNRSVQYALGITLGILVLVLLLSPKSETSLTPPPYRQSIVSLLPLYVENISTSVGIDTTLNLYFLPTDPEHVLRFEIYGLSYLNPDSSELTNPNVTAFKETFVRGLSLLRDKGIDPSKLVFIYGDVQYVRDTATAWVKKYNLLP